MTPESNDPIEQFGRWFAEAAAEKTIRLPEAACLSTIGVDDYPEGRMVLLKSFDARGFVFFTNWKSAKGRAMTRIPRAALTFYWAHFGRQVRVVGDVGLLAPDDSDAYFSSRPRDSRIGAWASEQSETLESRDALEESFRIWAERFQNAEHIPRPEHWPGVRLTPRRIEFWEERPNRLHDRLLYEKTPAGWKISRLAP